MAQAQEFQNEQQEVTPSTDPAYEAWFKRNVEAGLRDIREGRVVTHEQIKADAKARRERLLAAKRES